jgi:CubicO group peptidase (beta-lactamase class C family)
VVIYKGYVVAEFGDTHFVDPTYSVAKSMLSTVAGVAVRDGRIADLNQPVGQRVQDGGYASPHNALVTWKHHLQQESEWEGSMWGKNADFIGKEAFGAGERKPRTLGARAALRIQRRAHQPLRAVAAARVRQAGAGGVPAAGDGPDRRLEHLEVGALPQQLRRTERQAGASVSGGTRWGGGMWINSWDMARFGYLWLRGGAWNGKQILPPDYVKAALSPSATARLRLPVVAQHQGQEPAGPAGHRLCGAGRGQQRHRGLARPRPGDRVALACR